MAYGQSRRDFIRYTLAGGAAAVAAAKWGRPVLAGAPARGAAGAAAGAASGPAARGAPAGPNVVLTTKSRVALTTGEDRADIAFKALKTFDKEIAAAIGNKKVVLKPNNVQVDRVLSCSDAKNLEGALEFLQSIGKIKNTVIAESGAGMPTLQGFETLGYNPVAEKYGVKMLDLDNEGFEVLPCFDQNDLRPHPCRFSKLLLDPNTFIISAAKLKTHNLALVTLSLKNIIFGAPLKFGRVNDKSIVHGGGAYGIHFNLASLATRLAPHVALIDGYQGMEGDGPSNGTPVEHRVCVASMDWLAADRVGIELMGIDPANVGYGVFAAQNGMGQYNLDLIDVLGVPLKDHIKKYQQSPLKDRELQWMQPPAKP